MTRFLSVILIFLITLPSCGMVFAGGMNDMHQMEMELSPMVAHSGEMMSQDNAKYSTTKYNCCPDAHRNSLERDTTRGSDYQNVISLVYSGFSVVPLNITTEECKLNRGIPYRPNAPPDESEYCSLIGISVKNLN